MAEDEAHMLKRTLLDYHGQYSCKVIADTGAFVVFQYQDRLYLHNRRNGRFFRIDCTPAFEPGFVISEVG